MEEAHVDFPLGPASGGSQMPLPGEKGFTGLEAGPQSPRYCGPVSQEDGIHASKRIIWRIVKDTGLPVLVYYDWNDRKGRIAE